MRKFAFCLVAVAISAGFWFVTDTTVRAQSQANDNNVAVLDDCLPGDPGWNPTGGCTLKNHEGDVPAGEFFALLTSPLTIPPNSYLIGHPAWRNEPSHLTTPLGKTVRVTNRGGRGHTFTEVANFGGGFVSILNIGLAQAPQCTPTGTIPLPPGATIEIKNLGPGLHKFQCCIHPWMRATIRVE